MSYVNQQTVELAHLWASFLLPIALPWAFRNAYAVARIQQRYLRAVMISVELKLAARAMTLLSSTSSHAPYVTPSRRRVHVMTATSASSISTAPRSCSAFRHGHALMPERYSEA
jgi:hypothetical protein